MAAFLVRIVTLSLVALAMGASCCHVLEMPAKMKYDDRFYAAVNSTLYAAFAPGGAITMLGGILGAVVLAVMMRREPGFWWATAAAAFLAGALVAWWALVYPVNAEVVRAWEAVHPQGLQTLSPEAWRTPPETVVQVWAQLRRRWEYGHAAVFAIQLTGFLLLLISSLAGSPVRK
jgi:hypothetical protein